MSTARLELTQLPSLETLRVASESPRKHLPLASIIGQQHGSMSAREPRVIGQGRTCLIRSWPSQTPKPLHPNRVGTRSHESGQCGMSTPENGVLRQDVRHEDNSVLGRDFQTRSLDTSLREVRRALLHFGAKHPISAARQGQMESSDLRLKPPELSVELGWSTPPPPTVPSQQSKEIPEAKVLAPSAQPVLGNMQTGAPSPLSAGSSRFSSAPQGLLEVAYPGSSNGERAPQTLASSEGTGVSRIPRTTEVPMQGGQQHRSLPLWADPQRATTVRMGVEASTIGSHIMLSTPSPRIDTDVLVAVPHN